MLAMEISNLLPPAIAWLSMTLPRPRARASLAGGVVTALGLASLAVAGAGDWRSVGLPASYLAITAALLLLGAGFSIATAITALRAGELPDRPILTGLGAVVVSGLVLWIAGPVALGGGVVRTLVSVATIGLGLAGGVAAGRALGLAERLRRLDQRLFGQDRGAVPGAFRGREPLLILHLGLALVAFMAPHLVLLLVAAFGAVITGAMLARGGPWRSTMVGGLAVLALVSGFTISVAGEVPLSLVELRDGPFSPAFELVAAMGYCLAVWPLLGLFPFHSRWCGPATALAAAAVLLRIAVPVLSGGTEHWQPLIFPLLVLSVWYAAGLASARLAIVAVATAGLITLRPSAEWAGVILLAGEALVSTVRRIALGRRFESGVVGLVAVVMMAALVPLLTGALQTQTFYSVLLGLGAALSFLVREPAPAR
jgi:hypothetical protein